MNRIMFIFIVLSGMYSQLAADTVTVTTTADTGNGSLRAAIIETNAHAGPDTIAFAIPVSDSAYDGTVWWIKPAAMYSPIIDNDLYIAGATQDSSSRDSNPHGPDIIIDGRAITTNAIGFLIYSGNNSISGLTISGFADYGIRLRNATAINNHIWGNYIGTGPTGVDTLSNGTGIYISRGASKTLIGGEESFERNIISGNHGDGILLTSTRNNLIIGNYIGTDPTGTFSVANAIDGKHNGIDLAMKSINNIVGGVTANLRNIISGNGRDGIHISHADSNLVIGNYIGTDVTGTKTLQNSTCGVGDGIDIRYEASYNVIGGNGIGEGNLICASNNCGIRIHHQSLYNFIKGNKIGLDVTGTVPMGNLNQGIYIYDGSNHIQVGGLNPGDGNVISANARNGIELYSTGCDSNIVINNIIGLAADGLTAMPNSPHGIIMHDSTNYNQIGPGNLIAGNDSCGIMIRGIESQHNSIIGNRIGLDKTGLASQPNGAVGIFLDDSTFSNVVGGESFSSGNIISGNKFSGIYLKNSFDNLIQNNFIGTDTTSLVSLGNQQHGIRLQGSRNIISENIIAGNDSCGIFIEKRSSFNKFRNNVIGMSSDNTNGQSGILYADSCFAVLDTIGPGNTISWNGRYGIILADSCSKRITITHNSIFHNDSGAISLQNKANTQVASPVILGQDPLSGTAPGNSSIEIFSDSLNQAQYYEGTTTVDDNGNWQYIGNLKGPNITAVAIDTSGNTSVLAALSVLPVQQGDNRKPISFNLSQNYPNPFNPETTIRFSVKNSCNVKMKIYNVQGRMIARLVDKKYKAGQYEIKFDGSNLASGIYFYHIVMDNYKAVHKMILLR